MHRLDRIYHIILPQWVGWLSLESKVSSLRKSPPDDITSLRVDSSEPERLHAIAGNARWIISWRITGPNALWQQDKPRRFACSINVIRRRRPGDMP